MTDERRELFEGGVGPGTEEGEVTDREWVGLLISGVCVGLSLSALLIHLFLPGWCAP